MSAGTPFESPPSYHRDDAPWWWWVLVVLGCIAALGIILGLIPYLFGAWT